MGHIKTNSRPTLSAEESVVAGIITYPHLIPELSSIISAGDIICPALSSAYAAMLKLSLEGTTIDVLTVTHGMHKDHAESIYEILRTGSTENIDAILDHAQLVRDTALKRAVWRSASSVQKQMKDNPGICAHELIGNLTTALNNISISSELKNDCSETYSSMMKSVLISIKSAASSPGGITGLSTGYRELDNLTAGLQKKDLIIVAGRPSMGKTTFALNLMENSLRNGERGLFFSLEMPAEALLMRSISSIGSIPHDRLRRGALDVTDQARLKNAVGILKEFDIVVNDQAGLTISQLESIAHNEHHKKPLGIIVIDYIQLMSLPSLGNDSRANALGDVSKSLKQLAKRLNVPVIVLSQLNRSLEQRPNKRPMPSDLRDSGGLEQDADLLLFVYRDEVYHETSLAKGTAEIIIGKQRNGPLGTAHLAFEGRYSRFRNLPYLDHTSNPSDE